MCVGREPNERAARLQLGRHLGRHVLHRLEAGDDTAELHAFLRIGHGLVEHGLGCAERVGRQHHATGVANGASRGGGVVRGIEYLDAGARECNVGERTRLVERRLETGCDTCGVDFRQRGAAIGKHDQHVRRSGEIEDAVHAARQLAVVEAHISGAGLARATGEGHGDPHLAGRHLGKPFGLLCRARHRLHGDRRHHRRSGKSCRGGVVAECFGSNGRIEQAKTRAAVLGRNHEVPASPARTAPASAPPRSHGRPWRWSSVFRGAARAPDSHAGFHRAGAARRSVRIPWHQPFVAVGVTGFGSRGIPRPRSEMMFFWIWLDPPPMMRPRSYM